MRSELIKILGVPFYSYRTMLMVSFVVCNALAVLESRRRPGAVELSPFMGIWVLLGGLFGARLFYDLQYREAVDLLQLKSLGAGGMVFYGGLLGGVLAVAVHFRHRGVPFLNGADTVSPYLALGEAITRVGCFLNGCCWGKSTQMPWGVCFPGGSPSYKDQVAQGVLDPGAAQSLPVHPTQLYMTGCLLIVFVVLRTMLRHGPHRAGFVFVLYLLFYGFLRFFVELLRGDSPVQVAGMTLSGALSVLLALGAAAVLIWRNPTRY